MGAELDAVETVPQQRLLGVTTAERRTPHGDPFSYRTPFHCDVGSKGGRALAPAVGDKVPRSLAVEGMRGVLAVGQQLVADLTGREQLTIGALVEEPNQAAAPLRIASMR